LVQIPFRALHTTEATIKVLQTFTNLTPADISDDEIAALQKILPLPEEMDIIERLSPNDLLQQAVEKFVVKLAKEVPGFQIRINSIALMRAYEAEFAWVDEACKGCRSLLTLIMRPEIKQLLQVVLSIGNTLNAGKQRGASRGFLLTDLNQLKDTRSSDQQHNLLEWLATYLQKQNPAVYTFFTDEGHRELTRKIAPLSTAGETLFKLRDSFVAVDRELEQDGCPDVFKQVCGPWVEPRKKPIHDLVESFNQIKTEFTEVVARFSLGPTTWEDFFQIFSDFSTSFKNAKTFPRPK